jgi:hypothetical protein
MNSTENIFIDRQAEEEGGPVSSGEEVRKAITEHSVLKAINKTFSRQFHSFQK